ncbi:hypothetical protein ABS207_20680, partial [Acinetobacter baumannii]|uniref:hypothetical protein n=1 Tax=Acinetobacter baumannii TaxID=470 RepID=UPI003326B7EC
QDRGRTGDRQYELQERRTRIHHEKRRYPYDVYGERLPRQRLCADPVRPGSGTEDHAARKAAQREVSGVEERGLHRT